MKTRQRISRKGSKRYFAATARKTNIRNIPGLVPQKGGTRL